MIKYYIQIYQVPNQNMNATSNQEYRKYLQHGQVEFNQRTVVNNDKKTLQA